MTKVIDLSEFLRVKNGLLELAGKENERESIEIAFDAVEKICKKHPFKSIKEIDDYFKRHPFDINKMIKDDRIIN